jgi:hypothetical protein
MSNSNQIKNRCKTGKKHAQAYLNLPAVRPPLPCKNLEGTGVLLYANAGRWGPS